MKKFRFDPWLLILALLLALGMVLTLFYGREESSRHGYGRHLTTPPANQHSTLQAPPVASA